MLEFTVEDMTCGHCAGTITKAVKEAAPAATVEIDLPGHKVKVNGVADAAEVEEAIRDAGYTPVRQAA